MDKVRAALNRMKPLIALLILSFAAFQLAPLFLQNENSSDSSVQRTSDGLIIDNVKVPVVVSISDVESFALRKNSMRNPAALTEADDATTEARPPSAKEILALELQMAQNQELPESELVESEPEPAELLPGQTEQATSANPSEPEEAIDSSLQQNTQSDDADLSKGQANPAGLGTDSISPTQQTEQTEAEINHAADPAASSESISTTSPESVPSAEPSMEAPLSDVGVLPARNGKPKRYVISCATREEGELPDVVWKAKLSRANATGIVSYSDTSLPEIAKEFFGEESCWKKIWSLNPKIENPHKVPAFTPIKFSNDSDGERLPASE